MKFANKNTTNSLVVICLMAVSGCAMWAPPPPMIPAAAAVQPPAPAAKATIRGQAASTPNLQNTPAAGVGDHWRYPLAASGEPVNNLAVARGQSTPMFAPPPAIPANARQPVQTLQGGGVFGPTFPPFAPPSNLPLQELDQLGPLPPSVDFDVFVEEARTGRFMFGAGVNSDLGLTGQIVVDERNFDWTRVPTSFQDVINGTAWRGAGQGFRLEAMPGSQVQRYLASFTEPYFYLPGFADPFSLNLSGFYYDRRFFDWYEQRLGGRVALGYRLTHDLSLTMAIRGENVNIHDPRVLTVPELNQVVGDNSLFSGRVSVTHDTRDTAFAATEGHLVELSYEQVFGSFDYPRGEVDYRQYFLMRERPDGSGRHTLSYGFRFGFSGGQTPIFENYFAGGYSTLRGFDFRGASPVKGPRIAVGGEFRFLGTVQYMFPLTADDMIRGVVFCDYGTVEEKIEINSDTFRVAPGVGLRIAIPALGPAPLALDLAFPVAHAPFDDIQNFSFFFGFNQ
jgi:outer membrane protein insertion porin family